MGGLAGWPKNSDGRVRTAEARGPQHPVLKRPTRCGAAMEAPPGKRARMERPPFALFKQLAKEELEAAEANLCRLRAKVATLQEAANAAIREMVEVLEVLAANRADLKAAEEMAGRLRAASPRESQEAPRQLPTGAPGDEGWCPEHVFCGPNCPLREEGLPSRGFPSSMHGSEPAAGPFASGGLEPMS